MNNEKTTFSERLRKAMDAAGIRACDLAERTGVNKSTISQYLKGEYSAKHDRVVLFADVLGCDPMWLEGHDVPILVSSPDYTGNIPDMTEQLPVLGTVSAGLGVYAEENIIGYEYAERRYCDSEHFYLIVNGESMLPLLEPGDRILCERRDTLDDGDIGVFIVNGQEGMVKRFKIKDDAILLISANPYWPERRFEGQAKASVRIVAKVIQSIHNF